jgi:hypothetical protein
MLLRWAGSDRRPNVPGDDKTSPVLLPGYVLPLHHHHGPAFWLVMVVVVLSAGALIAFSMRSGAYLLAIGIGTGSVVVAVVLDIVAGVHGVAELYIAAGLSVAVSLLAASSGIAFRSGARSTTGETAGAVDRVDGS